MQIEEISRSYNKKTKIVATIGPASESEEKLEKMIKAGMNVARLNFSHGTHEWHGKIIKRIRKICAKLNANIGILADLQGPRIRVQTNGDIDAKRGKEILVSDVRYRKVVSDMSASIFFLDHPGIIDGIKEGNEILVEDGLIKVKVIKKEKNFLRTKVIDGGMIKNRKGVNIPDAQLNIGVITKKDDLDLKFSLENGVDFVALSFVSSAKDILDLRKKMKRILGKKDSPQIIAKIERKEAIKNLDEIIEQTDIVMVARGDLGIELDPSKVVIWQKEIIKKSLKKAKPVIVATQMLNSMIENPRPTRAEVSDVSNAVIDHTDAVMLSGESASGKYPIESVKMMTEIIKNTEESPFDDVYKYMDLHITTEYATVVRSAYEIAKSYDVKAIVMISLSGFTARLVSHFRPDQNILVVTNNTKTFNQFSLVWGISGYLFEGDEKLETLIDKMLVKAKKEKCVNAGDNVVVIVGRDCSGNKMRLVGIRRA
ncbi:MAG: Pyruvate kinase [Candidatus Moranbacteria bacterium GW2011_GWE2_35_2-]|nr:MAG: Pyruvate kinase [Candidatus Moranbacteria bacterium GW2011_GWE2_35_2-]KKQ06572.1 MAG: Pyruvate kinase [Candidatus Moranbacteria bacterium GW2011_GWF1_36_4]KKQ22460.1 MAG: Pyruvate kinase [Candidatus Moranbacteria bacterium GW2011_GWF2_37_11]KKQ29529.1 MAG: Pyruvate kinase [Candidatus Moranbacteria bacterium GW2011_GWD1_37_17]KKQ30601.1 MAG: Pyruvate kinase [Candidatus Moranbacteria bacterium GW2011_GWE1_37_24]KKQ48175.1 MAG: Pyruvate kinase [Candidatus Moranbacteria bacterium GW2011_GW